LAAVALLLTLGGITFGQTAPAQASSKTADTKAKAAPTTPAKKPATPAPAKPVAQWRRECLKDADFCVEVPAAWKSAGALYGGNGFAFAEPDPQKPADSLNQITVAALDLPQEGNKLRPTPGELIDLVLGSPAEGTTQETIQRSREVVVGMPAEIVKLKLHSPTGDWVEEVALLDADEVVYAIALVSAPGDVARLEPTFRHVMESWSPVPIPGDSAPAKP
jgi:hypothetical protein